MAMDVDLFVCQSGLALAGMTANDLVPQVRAAGLISFLADARADDRLLVY
jgi:predicted peroxiredoxin